MNDWFLRGDYGAVPTNYPALLIALLLAFACGHAIAWAYMFTHVGLSYSRSYVNTLILMPVVVALVMIAAVARQPMTAEVNLHVPQARPITITAST